MSKITDYTALSAPAIDDVLAAVDVSDTSMALSGTTKKLSVRTALGPQRNVTHFGAKGNYTQADDTYIQDAIDEAAAGTYGGTVTFPPGKYGLDGPVLLKPGVHLEGLGHAPDQGSVGLGSYGAILNPRAGFAVPGGWPVDGVIGVFNGTDSESSTALPQMSITNLVIRGNDMAATADGIAAYGPVKTLHIRNVGMINLTGGGISHVANVAGDYAQGWRLNTIIFQGCGGTGVKTRCDDFHAENVHPQQCGSHGWDLTVGNGYLSNCRADTCAGDGFRMTRQVGGPYWGGQVRMVNCGTQTNTQYGVHVRNASAGGQSLQQTVSLANCVLEGDGTNGGTRDEGLHLAGICAEGSVLLSMSNVSVLIRNNSPTEGCPQWALRCMSAGTGPGVPQLVQAAGGLWCCVPSGSPTYPWRIEAGATPKMLSVSVHGFMTTTAAPLPSGVDTPAAYSVNPL